MNYYQTNNLNLKSQLNNIFQVNDKVFVNGTNMAGRIYNNALATILMIDNNDDIYLVKFDDITLGIVHPIYGRGTDEISKIILNNNTNKIYIINVFDDGNDKYKIYENRWLKANDSIIGKGKVSLINEKNTSIRINSISKWKITTI